MARFDTRANLNRESRGQVPFLLELQTDLFSGRRRASIRCSASLSERSAEILGALDFVLSGI